MAKRYFLNNSQHGAIPPEPFDLMFVQTEVPGARGSFVYLGRDGSIAGSAAGKVKIWKFIYLEPVISRLMPPLLGVK